MAPIINSASSPVEMSNLTDDGRGVTSGPSIFSVAALNRALKETLEGAFPLVWVQGEISNFKAHGSGHFYFSLKDREAQISAVMFRGFNGRLKFRPEDGMEVVVRARVTVYPPRGQYQLMCELLEPVGAGAMQKAFEQLKAKLQAEGLFAPERKRPIPAHPRHVAVITSPTGAAIRDILNVLRRRAPGLRVTLIPAVVQGEQAPPSLLQALNWLSQLNDVDVTIIGRGGGSLEDLWCFNHEEVVRAIAAAPVPMISAVGHEVDFTLSDFVADLRAPTPSAAAELVAESALAIEQRLRQQQRMMVQAIMASLRMQGQAMASLQKRLVDPRRKIVEYIQRCDELQWRARQAILRHLAFERNRWWSLHKRLPSPIKALEYRRQELAAQRHRLRAAMRQILQLHQQQWRQQVSLLDTLSPLRVVDRGYVLVRRHQQYIVNAAQLALGDEVQMLMKDGVAQAKITQLHLEDGKTRLP